MGDEGAIWRYEKTGLWQSIPHEVKSRIVQAFAGAEVGGGSRLKLKASDVRGAMTLAYDRVAEPECEQISSALAPRCAAGGGLARRFAAHFS